MWSALRSRTLSSAVQLRKQLAPLPVAQPHPLGLLAIKRALSSSSVVEEPQNTSSNINDNSRRNRELLNLEEVEKILSDVKADNVKIIPVPKHYDFADYMVIATGRSDWHVRNIAQALIYKVKQKQKGAKRMLLPSVEGQEGGKWIVIDSGNSWFFSFPLAMAICAVLFVFLVLDVLCRAELDLFDKYLMCLEFF